MFCFIKVCKIYKCSQKFHRLYSLFRVNLTGYDFKCGTVLVWKNSFRFVFHFKCKFISRLLQNQQCLHVAFRTPLIDSFSKVLSFFSFFVRLVDYGYAAGKNFKSFSMREQNEITRQFRHESCENLLGSETGGCSSEFGF